MIFYLEVDINMFHCFVKDYTDLLMINILNFKKFGNGNNFPALLGGRFIYAILVLLASCGKLESRSSG